MNDVQVDSISAEMLNAFKAKTSKLPQAILVVSDDDSFTLFLPDGTDLNARYNFGDSPPETDVSIKLSIACGKPQANAACKRYYCYTVGGRICCYTYNQPCTSGELPYCKVVTVCA